jgi:nucleotide-binding universal stress UspA family protein
MIKDVIVNLATDDRRDVAADYAISLAGAFEAHVAGVAFALEPIVSAAVLDGVPLTFIEEEAANGVCQAFDQAATNAGLSVETRVIPAGLDRAAGEFARLAMRFDIAVLAQTEPDRSGPEALMIEAALLDSGRPLVVGPFIHKEPLRLDRVVVAWNGSRPAARAIGDALPLLRRAKEVRVVIVSGERGKSENHVLEGTDIGQHLARHGVRVEVDRIPAGELDVADALLSYAADAAADFMVMGGYGHSRLREFVLGGATRAILRSMTVPVLMSH